MLDAILTALREQYGGEWGRDVVENMRFSVEAEDRLREIKGGHLIGEPELGEEEITFTMWTDVPVTDLMAADRIAYDIFAKLAGDILFVERQVETKAIRYRFVTGAVEHGYTGSVVLAGPHAAAFADRQLGQTAGTFRYHA